MVGAIFCGEAKNMLYNKIGHLDASGNHEKNTCHMGRAGIRVGVASPVQDDSDKYINQYARCENKDTTV